MNIKWKVNEQCINNEICLLKAETHKKIKNKKQQNPKCHTLDNSYPNAHQIDISITFQLNT